MQIDDYIDRAHERSTTTENGYLPCARALSSQCGIAIARARIYLHLSCCCIFYFIAFTCFETALK